MKFCFLSRWGKLGYSQISLWITVNCNVELMIGRYPDQCRNSVEDRYLYVFLS